MKVVDLIGIAEQIRSETKLGLRLCLWVKLHVKPFVAFVKFGKFVLEMPNSKAVFVAQSSGSSIA